MGVRHLEGPVLLPYLGLVDLLLLGAVLHRLGDLGLHLHAPTLQSVTCIRAVRVRVRWCACACVRARVCARAYLFAQVLQVGDGVVEQVQEGLRGKELS